VKGANLAVGDRVAAVKKVALGVQVEEDRRVVPAEVAVARKAAAVAVEAVVAPVVRVAARAAVVARREAPAGRVAAVRADRVEEVEVRKAAAVVAVAGGEAEVAGRVAQEVVVARKVGRAAVGVGGKEGVREGLDLLGLPRDKHDTRSRSKRTGTSIRSVVHSMLTPPTS
jgi:hypothetical protein